MGENKKIARVNMIFIHNITGDLWIEYPVKFWFESILLLPSDIILENGNGKVAFVSPGTLEKEFTCIGEL